VANLIDHNPIPVVSRSSRVGETPAACADGSTNRLELPLAWETVLRPPTRDMLDAAEQANAGVLAFLLQNIALEARPRPMEEPIADAIAPIRMKLDLIIDMLARLSYREVDLPARRAIEFAPNRIVWLDPQPVRAGDWLRLRLYFHPVFRDPVTLFARAASCTREGPGSDYCIQADLVGVSERVEEDLVRLAFLAHRRQRAPRSAENARRGR